MGTDLFGISISGMNSAQIGLATTEHNIANANTPGFSRQQIVVSSSPGQYTGAGFIGQGSNVTTVKRIYDQFLASQTVAAQGQAAQLNTYSSQIQQINNMLADPNAGLAPALQDFFGAVNGAANSPESQPARQTLLSSAQTLSVRFQTLNQQLVSINNGVNGQITASVGNINSYAQQIAALNQNIASATSTGQPPNDLMDQRDQLITQLNQEITASVVKQSDGSYFVSVGNGQLLVAGSQAYSLQTVQSLNDPTKLEVAAGNGTSIVRLKSSSLQGGNLGGLLAFRSQSLDPAQNSLGLVALGLAGTFNAQHQLGQDLRGAPGGNLFTEAAPVVNSNSANIGNAVIGASIANTGQLTGSDYTLTYNAAGYTLQRLSDNTTVFSNLATLPATPVDGLSLNLVSGTPNAGDIYTIRPTVNGARDFAVAITDTAKIALAAPVRTNTALTNTGTGKIGAATVNAPPPTAANLRNNVTIQFTDATHYTVTDNSTLPAPTVLAASTPYDPNAGATLSFNGWTAKLSAAPNPGDTFTVGPNTSASTDNSNALLLAGLQTRSTLLGGTSSYQGVYGQLVSQIGNKTRELNVTSTAQNTIVQQAVQAQQAVSGVNLDEEAANLLRYQQAYQAAGKAMQIASTLFNTLLSIGG
ncbi:MAG: flagellar hook-associated protein FlgK [Pseudomonadota bacterium]